MRNLNPRDLEKRITDLEVNGGGGGGGSVAWNDVANKPFKTLSSDDFKVVGSQLQLKNSGGGGEDTPCIFITNTEEILAHTNDNKTIYVVSTYSVEGEITAFCGFKITMSHTPSDENIEVMTEEELQIAVDKMDFIDNVATGTTTNNTYSDGVYDCEWTNDILIGHVYITRPFYVTDGFKNTFKVRTNDSGVMAITY
jgi:hypothetical protein